MTFFQSVYEILLFLTTSHLKVVRAYNPQSTLFMIKEMPLGEYIGSTLN